jgi:phosphoribosyl 1,2-cyclic phosphodiesterase
MRLASLGSGSRGNATLVASAEGCVLVDCGFSVRETERRLAARGMVAGDLAALLVTHEHSDHLSGVLPLARRHSIPVFMTAGTARMANLRTADRVTIIGDGEQFAVGGLAVEPVAVPHDAREPVQYVFAANGVRFGLLTDLGSITPHVVERYQGCHALFVEANHDRALLASGPYPPTLKRRVGGAWGHLSNCQTADLVGRLQQGALETLVVGHVSQQNNSPDHVRQALATVSERIGNVWYADQEAGCDWLSLS